MLGDALASIPLAQGRASPRFKFLPTDRPPVGVSNRCPETAGNRREASRASEGCSARGGRMSVAAAGGSGARRSFATARRGEENAGC